MSKNLNTDQEIFDYVVEHLFKQNRVAKGYGICSYRGDGGTSCAVGCLIDDFFYSPSLECKGISSEEVKSAVSESGVMFSQNTGFMLAFLQSTHDVAYNTMNSIEDVVRFVNIIKSYEFDKKFGINYHKFDQIAEKFKAGLCS